MNLDVYTGFNAEKVAGYFSKRGWVVSELQSKDVDLVEVTPGAPMLCGDGRFDTVADKQSYGVRVLGGVNAVMALHTGGGETGLLRAAELVEKFGATPGTHSAEHGGCGFVDLWMAGKLDSVRYPYRLDNVDKGGLKIGHWLGKKMRDLGGYHFRLQGDHKEEAVRYNPFKGLTELASDGSRFRVDDWFLACLGITDSVRFYNIAETVEKLKSDAKKLEIIVQ